MRAQSAPAPRIRRWGHAAKMSRSTARRSYQLLLGTRRNGLDGHAAGGEEEEGRERGGGGGEGVVQ
eukprot:9467135-Pyramimonas_sp.AAC.1